MSLPNSRDVIEETLLRLADATRVPAVVRSTRSVQVVEVAAAVLCRRWKVGTLWLLASGCRHYSQLAARLRGISPKVLAQQLRELERDGLVTRHQASQGRRRIRYELTAMGEALRPLLQEMERWGSEYHRAHVGETRALDD